MKKTRGQKSRATVPLRKKHTYHFKILMWSCLAIKLQLTFITFLLHEFQASPYLDYMFKTTLFFAKYLTFLLSIFKCESDVAKKKPYLTLNKKKTLMLQFSRGF
jgi:hypothetical protein